ncbi:MAG TPA: outer membrane beta-barrel protein [Candidatus Acidoferrum sp.]|nr:outer membrane beta-barrel protein [Candidatus Acidoferrum sp.]
MRTLPGRARRIRWSGLLLLVSAIVAGPARGQNQELTFSLGDIPGQTRSFQNSVGTAKISSDRSFGINYGHRFLDAKIAALYGEIEFVAFPNRDVTSATVTVPQSYASLYLAPGLRLKFFPSSRFSPWGAIGGGYALYQQSAKLSNGQNETDKFLNRGVFDYGGGLDFRLFRFLGLRAEVRDFLSGNPDLNAKLDSSTQRNIVASGGLILRF